MNTSVERIIKESDVRKYTDISSLTSPQSGTVITISPEFSPQWQKNALIALFHIASLPENWDSYGSPPPLPQIVNYAERLLRSIRDEDLPVPHIIPVSGGGIQIEWSNPPRELELEILPDGSIQYLEIGDEEPFHEGELTDTSQIHSLLSWLTHATVREG